MAPARSMGEFLREWREEQARLSRARVAIAINAKLPKGRQIPHDRVRRWEEGQPPNSTEELEALCQTMREHGIAPSELKQFREAVFAASAQRRYPELFRNGE